MKSKTINPNVKSRFFYVAMIAILVSIGASLILSALSKNINLYLTPSEIVYSSQPLNNLIRVGGLVLPNSVRQFKNGLVTFDVSDGKEKVSVVYKGLLPGLFKPGKGVVVEGEWRNQTIEATQVLAKHDENYKPPKVVT
jgi:cytochrome c-type biogenesis protein CcmE